MKQYRRVVNLTAVLCILLVVAAGIAIPIFLFQYQDASLTGQMQRYRYEEIEPYSFRDEISFSYREPRAEELQIDSVNAICLGTIENFYAMGILPPDYLGWGLSDAQMGTSQNLWRLRYTTVDDQESLMEVQIDSITGQIRSLGVKMPNRYAEKGLSATDTMYFFADYYGYVVAQIEYETPTLAKATLTDKQMLVVQKLSSSPYIMYLAIGEANTWENAREGVSLWNGWENWKREQEKTATRPATEQTTSSGAY